MKKLLVSSNSKELLDHLLSDIPRKVHFKVNMNELIRILENEIENSLTDAIEVSEYIVNENEYYQDDVRYALYKYQGQWTTVCVQDFDFKDYDSYCFMIGNYSCGNIEQDAIALYRRDVQYINNKIVADADNLAKTLMNIIANNIDI